MMMIITEMIFIFSAVADKIYYVTFNTSNCSVPVGPITNAAGLAYIQQQVYRERVNKILFFDISPSLTTLLHFMLLNYHLVVYSWLVLKGHRIAALLSV